MLGDSRVVAGPAFEFVKKVLPARLTTTRRSGTLACCSPSRVPLRSSSTRRSAQHDPFQRRPMAQHPGRSPRLPGQDLQGRGRSDPMDVMTLAIASIPAPLSSPSCSIGGTTRTVGGPGGAQPRTQPTPTRSTSGVRVGSGCSSWVGATAAEEAAAETAAEAAGATAAVPANSQLAARIEPCPMLLRRPSSERWAAGDLRSALTERGPARRSGPRDAVCLLGPPHLGGIGVRAGDAGPVGARREDCCQVSSELVCPVLALVHRPVLTSQLSRKHKLGRSGHPGRSRFRAAHRAPQTLGRAHDGRADRSRSSSHG